MGPRRRVLRFGRLVAAAGWLALALAGATAAAEPAKLTLEIVPREAAVGDPLRATVVLELPEGTPIEPPDLGASIGPLGVLAGSWQGPVVAGGRARWTWSGSVAAYEVGALEIPPVTVTIPGADGPTAVRSEAVALEIRSVLPPEEAQEGSQPEIADLKEPAAVPPDYRAFRAALAVLGALLVLAAIAWWLHRRYAAKLAAVAAPDDPFRRVPPHVWAYEELQRLLDRRLAEEGHADLFFAEVSRILKRYLGGRYRVELMEHTTAELSALLREAGAPAGPVAEGRVLLEQCDLVKFARRIPTAEECRKAVELAYGLVDRTKPVEERAAEGAA